MKSQATANPDPAAAAKPVLPVVAATADSLPEQAHALARARAFAEPLLASETLDTGENILAHADAVAAILQGIGGSEAMQAASYLVYACDHLNKPQEVIAKAFGDNFAALAMETTKLVQVQRQARLVRDARPATRHPGQTGAMQTENVRKMLLAFSRDLRVVMLRLASRLQTLRYFAATKLPVPAGLAAESLQVFAPLANRLGIWEIKWEMEDLSFRFLEPDTYRQVAACSTKNASSARPMSSTCAPRLRAELIAKGIRATVQGRPKHIYSIVKKMRGKSLDFDQVYDIRALRIVVRQRARLLRRAELGAQPVHAGDGGVRRLHRQAQGQRLPVAAHRGARRRGPGRSRSRSAPRPCTTMPSTAWPRTGPTRRPAPRATPACRPAATTTPRSPCCASCWPGSATSRARSRRRACSTTASTCSRPMPPSSSCRRAPRRWTSPTACTPTWATAAAARASTAPWCRSTRR